MVSLGILLNENIPWFDSHKRQWGFSGYWAWDIAALVKLKGLSDINFKSIDYYPYGIVHFRR